ncbi:MAG: dockerin type I repeat-containing protein, partial [Planctomycetes bacterium]|nr:dockerin type I repeat-containing protein [Planctomycetota bacterium]
GTATSYTDLNPGSGTYAYSVIASDGVDDSPPAACIVTLSNVNPVTGLDCNQVDADVVLTWTNNGGTFSAQYDAIDVARNGTVLATISGTATTYTDLGAPAGNLTYTVTPSIGVEAALPAACTLLVFDTNVTDLVLRFEDTLTGDIDSSLAIHNALIANAQVSLLVDVVGLADLATQGLSLASFPRVWVELGTFPNNYTLSQAEGQTLADHVSAGGSVFLSGGDTHCFNPTTPIHMLTGVSDTCADGGFGIDQVDGIISPSCGLGEFINPVLYDGGEEGFIDRLSPLTTGEAVLTFTVGAATYNGGVFNATPNGHVISHSVEVGGIGEAHDQEDLISRYIECFPPVIVIGGQEFVRGDVNQDGAVNIADVVALLDQLFSGGAPSTCQSSLDGNDDGMVDVADAIRVLNFLFSGGAALDAPFPSCGEDATSDSLTCDSFTTCP